MNGYDLLACWFEYAADVNRRPWHYGYHSRQQRTYGYRVWRVVRRR